VIYILCASPTCHAQTTITAAELSRGLFAVLPLRGWSFEAQALDTEANWYCARCAA
jgi:hypothetical protein